MMNITIEIHYEAGSRGFKCGEFQLRGRDHEYVALQFWKQIKKELSYRAALEKVIVDGDRDITQLVKDLEEQDWLNSMNDDLPF